MKYSGLLLALVLLLYASPTMAQESNESNTTIGGRVYSDYYWMAQNHDSDLEGKNGFWIRRIYLTLEHQFNDAFSSRVRLEMNSEGDFNTSAKMVPNVKDAYLKWQNEHHQILAGISSTPTFGLTEDVWGYRSIEKSPQDLYDFGSSRDFGIAFKGDLDAQGKWNYHLFLGNGNGNKPEVDKGKKVMAALAYNITSELVVQGYVDYNSSGMDSFTAQGFLGYQSSDLNIGALYSNQQREGGFTDVSIDLVSVFANGKLGENVDGFIRADHLFDPYYGGSGNSYIPFSENAESSTFLVGGVDISLEENIHLMPNIESVVYGDGIFGPSPDTDVIPRLTLYYSF